MNIVVTGATSMIGVALIEEAIRNQCKVLAIVRENSKRMQRLPKSALIQVVHADLDSLLTIEELEESYDVFYHFAWDYTGKADRDNPVLQEQNIRYTLDAVELAKRLGCKKFIGAGSQAEYGKVDGVISKDTPLNPLIAYGMAKNAAGHLSAKLCEQYGIIHIWGRIFSIYGKYDNEGTMLNYAIDKFLNHEAAMFSAGTQMWDYLYESDAGKMFYLFGKKVSENTTLMVANGKSMPLKWYIEELGKNFETEKKCVYAANTGKPEISLEVDMSETEAAIQYIPEMKFSEGIKEVISYRKNGGHISNITEH